MKKKNYWFRFIGFGIIFVCFLGNLHAQTTTEQDSSDRDKPLGDTTKIAYYYTTDIEVWNTLDSTLKDFEYPYPYWSEVSNWTANIGMLGQPTFNRFFSPAQKGGFRVGLDQYSIYHLTRDKIPYYQNDQGLPMADLEYSQISQRNGFVRANFARQLVPQFYFSIHYSLINYVGFFDFQRTRHQNIALAFRYTSKGGKYRAYATLVHNASKQENNGGIVDDGALVNIPASFLQTISTQINSAQTQHRHTDWAYNQFFFNSKVDSVRSILDESSIAWKHGISFKRSKYKYFDTAPASDSSYYGNFQTNNRGIRHYVLHQFLENNVHYQQAIGKSFRKAPLWLRVYGGHRWHFVEYEPTNFQLHNVWGGLIFQTNPLKSTLFQYLAEGRVTTGQLGLDFFVKGWMQFDFEQWGKVEGRAFFQRAEPALIAEQMYVSQQTVWNNNFNQIQEFSLQGGYALPRWGFEFQVQNHTLTNWVYWDSMGVAQQSSASSNILQFVLRQNFKIKGFHLDNEVIWQRVLVGADFVRLPEWLFLHKLYWEGRVFKSPLARLGVNVRYQTDYFGNAFMPLTGQFFIQNERQLAFYPVVDIFLSAKIWQFRAFINVENVLQPVLGQHIFNALHYPDPTFFIRFGVSWRLFD